MEKALSACAENVLIFLVFFSVNIFSFTEIQMRVRWPFDRTCLRLPHLPWNLIEIYVLLENNLRQTEGSAVLTMHKMGIVAAIRRGDDL